MKPYEPETYSTQLHRVERWGQPLGPGDRMGGGALRQHRYWRGFWGWHGVSVDPAVMSGGTWTEAVLYSFNVTIGAQPSTPMSAANFGTIFSLTPPASPGGD